MADFNYLGDIPVSVTPTSVYSASFAYKGNIAVNVVPASIIDPHFSYLGNIGVSIKPASIIDFSPGLPYIVQASVTIGGLSYTNSLLGVINVNRQDNAATTFSLTVSSPLKPSSFLDKEIKIAFYVTDGAGNMVTFSPVVIGKIRGSIFTDGIEEIVLSGYDYSGVHNSFGELVSQDITTVLTGGVYADSAGQIDTGFAPIWAVNYQGDNEDIVDGQDFFVSTLTGKIEIPVSSNLINSPGGIGFSYMDPFASLKALIESIVAIKGWVVAEDGITMADYSATTKQPVISISNESIIEAVRKLIELSGAKVDANLYPALRIYSETVNLIGADNHIIDETTKYFEDSLEYDTDMDDLITKQTVRSVAKTFANVEISASTEIANKSGIATRINVHSQFFYSQSDVDFILQLMASMQAKKIVEVRISKSNMFSVSHVAGGTTISRFAGNEVSIQDSDWIQTVDDENIIYSLWVNPLIEAVTAQAFISYPGANWSLVINGTTIDYGEGTIEETVEVTGTRDVTGINGDLIGDVYENAYIETATHAGNIVNAILTDRGNFYKASFLMPLHESATMEIGDKLNIEKTSITRFKGIIKELNYSLNTETAEATTGVTVKGVGIGI
jgi:hypothetical protein